MPLVRCNLFFNRHVLFWQTRLTFIAFLLPLMFVILSLHGESPELGFMMLETTRNSNNLQEFVRKLSKKSSGESPELVFMMLETT